MGNDIEYNRQQFAPPVRVDTQQCRMRIGNVLVCSQNRTARQQAIVARQFIHSNRQ